MTRASTRRDVADSDDLLTHPDGAGPEARRARRGARRPAHRPAPFVTGEEDPFRGEGRRYAEVLGTAAVEVGHVDDEGLIRYAIVVAARGW